MCETFSCYAWVGILTYPVVTLAGTFAIGYCSGVLVLTGVSRWRLRHG